MGIPYLSPSNLTKNAIYPRVHRCIFQIRGGFNRIEVWVLR
nr:MAG TPA: hypothetical protein [Caudoviricetes sp.]